MHDLLVRKARTVFRVALLLLYAVFAAGRRNRHRADKVGDLSAARVSLDTIGTRVDSTSTANPSSGPRCHGEHANPWGGQAASDTGPRLTRIGCGEGAGYDA
jgi:hypothetical protein